MVLSILGDDDVAGAESNTGLDWSAVAITQSRHPKPANGILACGLERPHVSLWPRNRAKKWGRSSPTRCHSAAKSSVSLRSIASPSGTYQIGEVNARVTDTVICVFHAPFTLTTVAKTIETVDSLQNFHRRHSPLLLKRLRKRKMSEKILVPVHCSATRPEVSRSANCLFAWLHPVLGFDLVGLSLQHLPA